MIMKTYTIYDNTTGQITGMLSASTDELIQDNLTGKTYIEGEIDPNKYYISNGTPVAIPEKPAGDTRSRYRFDWATKTWTVDNSAIPALVRAQRNKLLRDNVDKINPIIYATLTTDQLTQLQAYRTALLNVPQQSGFPLTIEWPTKPSWL